MKSRAVFVGVLLLLASAVSALAGHPDVPVVVSPGNSLAPVLIDSRCPTFSWGAVAGAQAFELVVYRVGEEPRDAEPVLQQRLPGSASSWTPALARCLESGGRYAWTVRAIDDRAESEWSELRLFELTAEPTRLEVERALWTLRRYLASESGERPPERFSERTTTESLVLPPVPPSLAGSGTVPTAPDLTGLEVDVPSVTAGDVAGRFGVVAFAGESGSQDNDKSIAVYGQSIAEFGIGVQGEGSIGLDGFSRGFVAARLLGMESAQGLWVDSRVCCDGAQISNYVATIWNQANGLNQDPDVLALGIDQFSPGANSNFIGFFDLKSSDGSAELIGEIEADGLGGVHFTGSADSLLGPGADFAEYLPRLDPTEVLLAGDVVGVHSGAVSRRTEEADQILIVTSKPLVLGRRPPDEELSRFVAVALLGQVPVRVAGSVGAGDYLVASGRNDGRAVGVPRAELDLEDLATLVGRALTGTLDGEISVDALVGVFDGRLVGDLARNQAERAEG